ncbi:hypothetical protein B0H12DRAFT_241193 [Mycena haematopus]|nr:hypothetical protein B0H12DRAFT_241193 [Mycena haematopus]
MPDLIQADGTAPAPAQPQTELDTLLARVQSNKQILNATRAQVPQASSSESSPVVVNTHTRNAAPGDSEATPPTLGMPDSASIAALRRQYAKYHSEAISERQSNVRWLAETAASAALINILTKENDALTRENDMIKEENMRLRDSVKRLDPNGRELSTATLASPTTEPVDGDSPRLPVERDDDCDIVPSSQSQYLLPMEGVDDSRSSQDKQEEEQEEHVEVSHQEQVELGRDEVVEEDTNETGEQEQCGVEQRMVVEEEENAIPPETIQIKRERVDVPAPLLDDPARLEIIDLTLDDSDDETEDTSAAAPAPAPTMTRKISLDVGKTRRDLEGAHDKDSAEVDGLQKPQDF